jgi:hypothetical protein
VRSEYKLRGEPSEPFYKKLVNLLGTPDPGAELKIDFGQKASD